MLLKNMFNTLKQTELAKQLDQFLLISFKEDADRRRDINSPSSALGCVRASYYHKTGHTKKPPTARLRRIFDNGHGVHRRLQKYLRRMGVLILDEVPVYNVKYNILGSTDGILAFKAIRKEIKVLEIKSINSRGFQELKEPKREHKAQATVYLFCIEKHRKWLRDNYKNAVEMEKDSFKRIVFYNSLYQHLKDDDFEGGKTKEQKIERKMQEHLALDKVLIGVSKPVTSMIILYENKDNQEIKDYEVVVDDDLLKETLNRFVKSNIYTKLGKCPPRECKNRSTGCDYSDICWR